MNEHHHPAPEGLSFNEKMVLRIEHWIQHNRDHAETYKNWARNAKANGLENAARLLEEAAGMTESLNGKLEQALEKIREK